MTIKDTLKQRYRDLSIFNYGLGAFILLLVILKIDGTLGLILVLLIIDSGSYLYRVYMVQCPECAASVIKSERKHNPFTVFKVPDVCADCGCNYLDEATDEMLI
ncbi:hypothetical protein OS175_04180 [Marinicella sp. S1101]|uniref:hypothetical protein n=1 Tax=Marinicella marina TaxID=2996016 RepID=UPI002260C86D|nr:hypothetical protein [Marinicella marina]MCX7553065.1 hypothetical protein [Marinicella marina]MDJ1139575.1 hypothetical protein [Marinicella marina]